MSVSRIVDSWIRLRVRRPRQLRLARRLALEPLENRTALAGALDLSVASVPAEIGSAGASPWWGHDAIERDDASQASPQPAAVGSAGPGALVVAAVHVDSSFPAAQAGSWFRTARADSPFAAAGVKISSSKDAKAVLPPGHTDAGTVTAAAGIDGPTPFRDPGTVDGGQSSSDPSTSPSQDGSSGGTNTPPDSQGQSAAPTPTDPTGQIFQTNGAEDQVDPGLLDPLAWTVPDEQPPGEGTESFDGEDPLLMIVGAGAAGPSTLMGRPDETGIGSPSDYRSIAGWRASSFESLEPGGDIHPGDLRHPLRIDPREDSIAAGTAPWRGLLSGSAPDVESGLSDQEHIAELSPLAGSISLALAATLWSTPARIQTGPGPGKTGLAGAKGHVDVEPTTSSWKVFVMGLDRAFDRSYAEVHRGLSAETFGASEREEPHASAAWQLEWRGAIVPAPSLPEQDLSSERPQGGEAPATGAGDSFVPALIQLGELLLENLLNPVFGHENGGNGNSQ